MIAVAVALATAGVLAACGPDAEPTSVSVDDSPSSPVVEESPSAAPSPSPIAPEPAATSTTTVTGIVDGDTIDTSEGRVRVIGIDTPEKGQCGFEGATQNAAAVVPVGSTVTLTAVSSMDDTDKYGRLLRYVTASNGTDLGLEQINDGLADARYDSRDGYGAHPQEAAYIAADMAPNSSIACPATAPAPKPTTPAPDPTAPASAAVAEPWNMPGPDLDCPDIGHRVFITGPDYHRLDRDGDGIGCESY